MVPGLPQSSMLPMSDTYWRQISQKTCWQSPAEKAQAENIENISFQCAAIASLQIENASIDAVLALSVLHLLPDWRMALASVYDMLRPGGLLVSSTACIGDMGLLMRMLPPVMKVLPMVPAVQAFTAAELKSALEEVGFELEQSWQPGRDQAVFIVARKPTQQN